MALESLTGLASRAEKAFHSGNYAESAALFQQAAARCLETGDEAKAAEYSNNRSVALLKSGDAQSALEAARGTDQVFLKAGDARRQALALGNQASALEALGKLDEALALFRQSADLLKQTGDKEARAYVLKSISALQVRTGHQLEALASMDAALENAPRLTLRERMLKKLLKIPFQMLRR